MRKKRNDVYWAVKKRINGAHNIVMQFIVIWLMFYVSYTCARLWGLESALVYSDGPLREARFIYISLQLLLVDFDRSPVGSSRPLDRLFSAQRSERTICPLLSLGLGPQPPPTRIYRENGCTAVYAHYSWSAIAFLISWTGVLYIRYARLTPKGLMDGLRYQGFPFFFLNSYIIGFFCLLNHTASINISLYRLLGSSRIGTILKKNLTLFLIGEEECPLWWVRIKTSALKLSYSTSIRG